MGLLFKVLLRGGGGGRARGGISSSVLRNRNLLKRAFLDYKLESDILNFPSF